MTLIEWFSNKRATLFDAGNIYRYQIVDTRADEWNSLEKKEELIEFKMDKPPISKSSSDKLGIKFTIKCLGIYWLVRFNA